MINWLMNSFLGKYLATFIISMIPVIELRAAIPLAVANGVNPWLAYLISVLGNMVPVPFIILFIRKIFNFIKSRDWKLARMVEWFERRAHIKGKKVQTYGPAALLLFVAVPLPMTGAWTGALIAALLELRLRAAVPVIFLGVMIAGIIVTAVTCGASSLFGIIL